jgi:tRNA1(Val) A37 N6-methylase TrmN6
MIVAVPPGLAHRAMNRAQALGDILMAFEGRFGDVRVLPLYARDGDVAIRIIVSGIKGSRAPLTILAGFVLHTSNRSFTPQAQAILRDGAPLPLARRD